MIREHRRGEGAGEVDTSLYLPTAVETNGLLPGAYSSMCSTGYSLAFRLELEVEPSLLHQNSETRDRGPFSRDILNLFLDVIHILIYSRAF